MKKYVLVDGKYVVLETWQKTKRDIVEPPILNLNPQPTEQMKQYAHEMKFTDLRKFCKENDIKYSNRDKKVDLIRKVELYYEEREV